mmetsp:Transcript_75275/g.214102  ORF Transcript_75275/g.214102 Transcript_75275/m.214102 type:complete len:80 (-) Transcript_75275:611-850(-)
MPPVPRRRVDTPAIGGIVTVSPAEEGVDVDVDADHTTGGASFEVVASCGIEYATLWQAALCTCIKVFGGARPFSNRSNQ